LQNRPSEAGASFNPQTDEDKTMKKFLIVAVVALSAALGACGGGLNNVPGNGNNGNLGNGGNGNNGYTYPQACQQFCQVIATRALDCVVGHGHYTQQDLQKNIDDCNRSNQTNQTPPTTQQCQTATNNVNAATCTQLCNAIGQHC